MPNTVNRLADLLNQSIEYKRQLCELLKSPDELSRLFLVRQNIPETLRKVEYLEKLLQPAADEIAKGKH